jgi:hypothetical protein
VSAYQGGDGGWGHRAGEPVEPLRPSVVEPAADGLDAAGRGEPAGGVDRIDRGHAAALRRHRGGMLTQEQGQRLGVAGMGEWSAAVHQSANSAQSGRYRLGAPAQE